MPLHIFPIGNSAKEVLPTVIYAGTLQPSRISSPTISEIIKFESTSANLEDSESIPALTLTAEANLINRNSTNDVLASITVSPFSTDIMDGTLTPTNLETLYTAQDVNSTPPVPESEQGIPGFVPPSLSPTSTPFPTKTPVKLPPWIASSLKATDPKTFKLASGKLQFVHFFAFWDGNSQAIAPYLHSLEDRYRGKIKFVYLDIDDPLNDWNKQEMRYRYQPHYFLIDEQGNVIKQWLGYVKVEQLIEAFDAVLK